MDNQCEHMDFHAAVEVARVTDGEDGPIAYFMANVRIRCAQCEQEMTFLGLPRGLNPSEPMAGAGGLEARLPIRPFVAASDLIPETMKYTVAIPKGES